MTGDPLFLLVIAAVAIVAAILVTGIGSFAKGGDFHKKNANRIMRYRIYAQAVAVALIMLYIWLHGGR